jgi:hypothetical protein
MIENCSVTPTCRKWSNSVSACFANSLGTRPVKCLNRPPWSGNTKTIRHIYNLNNKKYF